jgi:hypothetical protein
MTSAISIQAQSADPADWATFYTDLQAKGNVPDAACALITPQSAVFRGMYQDLAVIKESIRQSGTTPVLTTIYADVLAVPAFTNWLLESTGLVIYARRVEIAGSATVLLDYQQSTTAQVVVFASEVVGTLTVSASKNLQEPPVLFSLTQANVAPGMTVSCPQGVPTAQVLQLAQGFGMQPAADMQLYLTNGFIFGSLLYDQQPALALAIFLWVKGWAAQSPQLEELFYRSTSLAALLNAQVNAAANGATFVPYLTANVYTTLAEAFAADAAKYEADYQHLSTQKVFTDTEIALAKTMVANSQSEVAYVSALLQQANDNYTNAQAAATKAQRNFSTQQLAVTSVAANFQQIGIPDYEREQIIKAVVSLVTAVVTFGAGIAAMAMGDEAAAPAVAEGAVSGAEAVAQAASTGAELAKTASSLATTMAKLKKLVETLQKVYELAQAVKEVADNLSTATDQMQVVQAMQDTTDGADLSAADGWAVYKLQVDNVLQDSVDKGISYAADYREALDILVIYGQSQSAAQLAVIKAGQQAAAIIFQLHYAQQKQANLQGLVDALQAGEAPALAMMQQFYQKYLDGKSSLFAALKSYQAAFFYWALQPSAVQPQIVDPVTDLNAGIQDITKLPLDQANALGRFDPPPQQMENILIEITDAGVLQQLQTTGQTTWVLPLENQEFAGLNRVRITDVRIWLEGTGLQPSSNSVYLTITTAGNYLDRYQGINYQFNSKPLTRSFKYMVATHGQNPDWQFADGTLGFVQIDGAVDKEVAYAYFQPTPFSEWTISLLTNNPGLDYSRISKITMYFEGTAVGATAAMRQALASKSSNQAHANA